MYNVSIWWPLSNATKVLMRIISNYFSSDSSDNIVFCNLQHEELRIFTNIYLPNALSLRS